MRCLSRYLATAVCAAISVSATAQESSHVPPKPDQEDHSIVFEFGIAGDWTRGEAIHGGGTFAFEVTPIEHWFELEVGATAIAADGGVEMPFDVLFKKPWQPSPKFEFMIGIGPEIVHASGHDGGTFWGAEGVLDFMFWPKPNIGWYIEPGYEFVWRNGEQRRGIGMAVGLLIGR
jgi:hypothetical protein